MSHPLNGYPCHGLVHNLVPSNFQQIVTPTELPHQQGYSWLLTVYELVNPLNSANVTQLTQATDLTNLRIFYDQTPGTLGIP